MASVQDEKLKRAVYRATEWTNTSSAPFHKTKVCATRVYAILRYVHYLLCIAISVSVSVSRHKLEVRSDTWRAVWLLANPFRPIP